MKLHIQQKILYVIVCLLTMQVQAQTLDIAVDIEDEFLKVPLTGVKVSVLNLDSTVVVDAAKSFSVKNLDGRLIQENYMATVKAVKKDYLIRVTKEGYGEVWTTVSVLSPQVDIVRVPTIKMRKENHIVMKQVVVTATKIKMYHKGDTLVYNADAFKLPDGSMLDALISQLPGVVMNDFGEIFVNGRKVDELLLGSRSFMRGNKKVLMENLPYYTVKDIKVYEKQTDRSEVLGYDVEPRKFVMDVNLKNEYNQGYIVNVEAAGGTEKRWLGRGFLLGFTDLWRYSLLGNMNNVNESRHIGRQGYWTPATMPQSLLTTRSVATDLDYQSKDKNVSDNLNIDYTSSGTEMEMRKRYEQFIENIKPMSLTVGNSESDNWTLKLSNNFMLKKSPFFDSQSSFEYGRWNSFGFTDYEQWDDELRASMRTNNLSEGRRWNVLQSASMTYNINEDKKWHGTTNFILRHSDEQSWLSSRFSTWQTGNNTDDVRHNASDVSDRLTNIYLSSRFFFDELWHKVNLKTGIEIQYSNRVNHDYLYHPDTLLLVSQLDMLTAITDPSNSYDSRQHNWFNKVYLELSGKASYRVGNLPYKIWYDRWNVGIDVPVILQSLDYKRGVIDTLLNDSWVFFNPRASFRHMSPGGNHDFRFNINYSYSQVDLFNRIGYRDDSQPLVVKLGNPDLKNKAMTKMSADYTNRFGKNDRQFHAVAIFDYRHRDVAQSVSYNPVTGVYTYMPMNISGAYTATAKFDYSSSIGEKKYWSWQMNADVNYDHSVDHAMLSGETESHENTVNTTVLHDGTYIQYNKGVFNIRASGDIRWRHSEGKMYDFNTLNALDFNYGLSTRYTIPRIKTTLSADATMYSRRGYGSAELNTDDFVLNASLSQSLWKGKLIARIEAFDLLHQVSSTQYTVNAQGRTETWYRSLPNYVMFHLVYHWNRNPKSK